MFSNIIVVFCIFKNKVFGQCPEMLGTSILVSLASLIVSFVGFANQIVLAKLFGTSMSMDAYLIAISIPMLVSGILSTALGSSLVPALMSHKSNLESYRRFSGLLFISMVIISIVISGVGFTAAPAQISLLGHTLLPSAKQDAIAIARVSWFTAGTMLIVGNLRAMHNADNRFLFSTFASLVPFVCMILAGLLFASSHGPLAVAWGMLVGFLLNIPLLLIHTSPALDFSSKCFRLWKAVTVYLSHSPLTIFAMLSFTVFQSIDAYWAPQIGTGNLAYLSYSQRIVVALGSLVIAGPATVILPRLAAAQADGRIMDLLRDTLRALKMVVAFALPVVLLVSILATPFVRLLFERGEFDRHATQGVAELLPLMMGGMIAMLCVVMVFKALFAKHDIFLASTLGIFTATLYFVLSGLFSLRLGVKGIALAYAITWCLIFVFSILTLWRGYIKLLLCRENFIFFGKLVVIAGVTSMVVVGVRTWIYSAVPGDVIPMLQLSMMVALFGFVYGILSIYFLRIEEIRSVFTFVTLKITVLTSKIRKKTV